MLSVAVLIFFYVIILLYSVIIHEVAHGVAALWLGDPTAKYAGRLTADPRKHVDPWMTVAVPILMLILSGGRFSFSVAKPVPYNPYNLKNQRWGPTLVALAGPLSNILLALIFAMAGKFIGITAAAKIDIISNFNNWSDVSTVISGSLGSIFFELFVIIIFWNVLLAFFNLIPFPPLDGSKLLLAFLPIKTQTVAFLEQFGFFPLIIFILFFSGPLGALLNFVLGIFLGITI